MTKIAHLADLHLRKEKANDILIALDSFEYKAREENVRLIAISGDIWDGAVQNTEGSMFPVFVERIRRLAEIAPVVLIYGTPSHDTAGSLDVFETLDSTFGITVLRPGIGYILANGEICRADEAETGRELLIFGVPEPSKKWLLANAPAGGKETAAEAAAQALQNLFLGLAAKRQQHSDLPCIVLYHGRVLGARFANGQVSTDGVPRDVLTSVGADYYALGDIHEPQEIDGTPNARYPGSLYACNWGEEHQPGWNLVGLDEFGADYTRVDFPLPQQRKIPCKAADKVPVDAFRGFRVWLEITATKEEAAAIDTEMMLKFMHEHGAEDGSRVTLNIQATETVRAAEITEKTRLRDKVSIWAEASGETVDDRILDKADDLEEEAKRSGVVSSSAHIRLKKLVLRGAIGIWKGQRKEEIVIDLDNLDQGLIALVGINGAGKTTLIENLHPWPQMLTRSGKLQDHFTLRDSFRDLYFVDERTGTEYRALLSIDGKNKSGSIEYHLYRNTGSGFEPVPDINGRREVYIEKIEELFGSLQLYLKSAFISQRPSKSNPDLSDTTKGEKKQLFAELAGVDYLAGYAEIAKEKAKAAEGELVREEARRDTIAELLENLPELEEKLDRGRELTADIDRDLERKQRELDAAETKMRAEEVTYRHQSEIKQQIDENGRVMAELNTSIESIKSRVQEYQTAANGKAAAEQAIEEFERASADKASLIGERGELYEQYQKDSALWNNQTKALRDNEQALHAQEKNLEREIARLNSDVAVAETSKQSREKHLLRLEADEKMCPTCGQTLPADAVEKIEAEIREIKREIEELIEQQKQVADEIGVHQKALEEVRRQIGEIEYPPEIKEPDTVEIDAQIEKLADALAWTNIEGERLTLQKAQEAEVRIQELTTQLSEKNSRLAKLSEADKALRADFDIDYREAFEAATTARDERQGKVQELRERRAGYTARIEELEGQITQLHEKRTELDTMAEKIAQLQQTASDWRVLEQACGRDGIQALELDALAPNIAEVANRILQAAYGSKFFIEFRTTKMSGSGSRTKQLETFDIFVLDNEDGTEQTLETLSGGESVWIKGAIYEAFGIIRGRNTGLKFLTAIKDEADGALDPVARERYCRMLEKAHAESGQYQTIIITHSREIQEMIQQTIDISALEARKSEEVAA